MRNVALIGVVVLLGASSPALAKEPQLAVVCGADACTEVEEPGALIVRAPGDSIPSPQPFYAVELDYGDEYGHASEIVYFAPAAGLLATLRDDAGYMWSRPPEAARARLDRIVRDLRPFPRPRFAAVLVGGRAVSDPGSYERLFTIDSAGPIRLEVPDWQPVEFVSNRPNPWSLGRFRYSPGSDILSRNLEWVKVPPRQAAAMEARTSLDSSAGQSFDWPLVTGSLLVALALGLGAAALSRRRPETAQ